MEMVSTTEGWLTYTCWKRRSSAGSFSMCLRYSSCLARARRQRSRPQCLLPDSWQQGRATPVAIPDR